MMYTKRKTFISSLLILLGFMLLLLPNQVLADSVDDQAGLFTNDQITLLNQQAEKLNEQSKSEVFIVTTTTNTEEPRDFADDYLRDKVGNNNNGAVFLMDMGQRQIYISTSGNMIYYLTDSRRDELLDSLSSQMSDAQYFATAQTFLTDMSTYVDEGMPDGYSIDEETGKVTKYKSLTGVEIVISIVLALGLGAAFFIVTVSRYQLKLGGYH
ncbi:MAG: TPM domain-containing protein, partial [Enterococcus sp.]